MNIADILVDDGSDVSKVLLRQYLEGLPRPRSAVNDYDIDITGTTNVASAVQAALNECATDKRDFYSPEGIYLLGGSRIRVPSNVRWFGDGIGRTILKRTEDNTPTTGRGTVEVYGSSNVHLSDMSIDYTPATGTLGYGQTGWCARNGAHDVLFQRLGVSGKLNRQFHIINAYNVVVDACQGYGGSNAALRVVSDYAANVYAEMSDESAPVQVRNVRIQDCLFSGATTLMGTTRAGTSYGINIAGEIGASDSCSNIEVINTTCRYFDGQGFATGGKGAHHRFINCFATDIGITPTSGQGVGFMNVVYGTPGNYHSPSRVLFSDCQSYNAGLGFYLNGFNGTVLYNKLDTCFAAGGQYGFLFGQTGIYNSAVNCIAENVSGYGFYLGPGCTYHTLDACHSIGNQIGIYNDAGNGATNQVVTAIVRSNSTANYQLNGATAANNL